MSLPDFSPTSNLRRDNIVAELAMQGTCLNAGEGCTHTYCNLILRARAAIALPDASDALRTELRERRACLVAARDDLARIAKAKTEDGGLWVRAVAEARLPFLDEALANTDAALEDRG